MKKVKDNSKLSNNLRETAATLMTEAVKTKRADLLEASIEMVTAANKLR